MNVDFVKFSGLRHYAVGNAILLKKDNALVVSEIDSAMDGIAIDTGNASDVSVHFLPLEIKSDTMLGITFNAVDHKQRLKSIGQWAITQSEHTNAVNLLLNTKLEGQYIQFTGKKNHQKLFRNNIDAQRDGKPNWLIVGSFQLSGNKTLLSDIDCSIEAVRNKQGKIVQIITTKIIGSAGRISPACSQPLPVSDTIGNTSYHIDELHISSVVDYPEGLPYEWGSYISQVMITGQDVASLTLKNTTVY